MRSSWIEKNRSRNKIDWERTKNDVSGVVSLLGCNLIHTSWLGGVDLRRRLATVVVVVVASGTWWSVLNLLRILVTLTSIVTCLATLVAYPINSAGVPGCSVELGGTELSDEAPHRMASVHCSA